MSISVNPGQDPNPKSKISNIIAAQKRKNAKTDIIQVHIDNDEAPVIMRTKIVEKPHLDTEVLAFTNKAHEIMRTEVVEETISPMQLEAASPVEGNPSMLTNYSTPGWRRKRVISSTTEI